MRTSVCFYSLNGGRGRGARLARIAFRGLSQLKLKMGCFALPPLLSQKSVSYHTARNVSSTIGFPCDDAQVHVWRFRTAISMVFSTAIWVTILI